MLSSELVERVHAFLLAVPSGGPLDTALEVLPKVYREALPKGGPPLEADNAQELMDRTRPWRAVQLAAVDTLVRSRPI